MERELLTVDKSNPAFSSIVEFLVPILLFDAFVNVHKFQRVRPWKSDEFVVLTSKAEPRAIRFNPYSWIKNISHFEMPALVTFYQIDGKAFEISDDSVDFGGDAHDIVSRMSASAVISFYQRQLACITSKYGPVKKRNTKWPETLKFLRHIRNGLAHGEKLNFNDDIKTVPGADPATWRGIYIDGQSHGRKVFREVIQIGDIPLLLADAGDLL